MRNPYGHAYPPAEWTVQELASALDSAQGASIPTYADAATWERIASDDLAGPIVDETLEYAETTVEDPIRPVPGSAIYKYLNDDFSGQLTYGEYRSHQMSRLTALTIAECVERDGRFLDRIVDYAWSLCNRASWVDPGALWRGHDEETYSDGLPRPHPEPRHRTVDLKAKGVGIVLAELSYLLGDQLPSGLRERIRDEVLDNVIEPYERRDDYWWLDPPTNNWNASCNAGVLRAALYVLEDDERLARIVRKGVRSLRHYLNGFGPDGGTVEGVGYWNGGFGHYLILADHLESVTGGDYSLFEVPVIEKIATFPVRVELAPGQYPPFSDANEDAGVAPYIACEAGRRLGSDRLVATGRRSLADRERSRGTHDLPRRVRDLVWTARTTDVSLPPPPASEYFEGIEWWVARADRADPESMAVAMKGGDNAESHNHNDCGSFVVSYRGESLFADLGSTVYSPGYGSEDRYTRLVARSLGHPVPYVNGVDQAAFADYAGKVKDENVRLREVREPPHDEARAATVVETPAGDLPATFALDLADCYPEEAGLESLLRSFEFDPAGGDGRGALTVRDIATFREAVEEPEFETVLVGYHPMTTDANSVTATGDRGRAVASIRDEIDCRVERIEDAVMKQPADSDDPVGRDVCRARIGPVTPGDDHVARMSYEIVPKPA